MKFRQLVVVLLSAGLIFAAGCGAPDDLVSSENSSAADVPSSEPLSAVQSAVSKPESSQPIDSGASAAPASVEWVAYIDDEHNLRVKKQDGTDDRLLVKDVAEAPCVAGEWVYYMPDLDAIDKVKLDGSQKTKVCGTDAFVVYNANANESHEINGSTSVTAAYQDGSILYTCVQLHEAGDKANPPSCYKLDLERNTITPVRSSGESAAENAK